MAEVPKDYFFPINLAQLREYDSSFEKILRRGGTLAELRRMIQKNPNKILHMPYSSTPKLVQILQLGQIGKKIVRLLLDHFNLRTLQKIFNGTVHFVPCHEETLQDLPYYRTIVIMLLNRGARWIIEPEEQNNFPMLPEEQECKQMQKRFWNRWITEWTSLYASAHLAELMRRTTMGNIAPQRQREDPFYHFAQKYL